jgi:hypothetical protein
MPRPPHPYPFSFGTPAQVLIPTTDIIAAPHTQWQSDPKFTYQADNPGTYPANGWFQGSGCTKPGCIAWLDGFVFGSHDPANQQITFTLTPAEYPNLAPNRPVRVRVLMDWYRYTFAVNNEARVRFVANGVTIHNIPENLLSGYVGSGPVWFNITTVCDASGNIDCEFGIFLDDGIGSTSIGATLDEIVVESIDESWDIIPDSAICYREGNIPISITREGASFDPRIVWDNYEYEGKRAPVYGHDEPVSMSPVVRVKFMEVSEDQIALYQPGGVWGDTAFDRTLTPPSMGSPLATSFALNDFRCVWKRWSGGYLQARFPKAFVTGWSLAAADKNEGEIPVMIEARQDLTGGLNPKTTPLFYIDRLPSTWTV